MAFSPLKVCGPKCSFYPLQKPLFHSVLFLLGLLTALPPHRPKAPASDLFLRPVQYFPDPIRGEKNYLVMCEVFHVDGKTPHESNTRSQLREVFWIKVQMKNRSGLALSRNTPCLRVLNLWAGRRRVFQNHRAFLLRCWGQVLSAAGRLSNCILAACQSAGIYLCGINAEVMLGQWEFQIGHRGFEGEDSRSFNYF